MRVANETIEARHHRARRRHRAERRRERNSRRARSARPNRRRRDDAEPQPPERVGAGRLRGDSRAGWPPVSSARAAHRPRGATPRAQHRSGDRRARPNAVRLPTARHHGVARAHAGRCACLGRAAHRFPAWWIRRTYYLFQMPRWDRRLRIVLDWTVALFFRPDITKVELRVERQLRRPRGIATNARSEGGDDGRK